METIFKHLSGVEQYMLLQKILGNVVVPNRLPQVIQEIMNDLNKKRKK